MKPPVIKTERLLLRFPEPSEAENVLEYFVRNREHLEPWSPSFPATFYTREYWTQTLSNNLRDLDADKSARFFVFHKDEPSETIGVCNLNNIVRGAFQACHLGYSLDHERLGQGLMTESVTAIVEFAFQHLELHRVMANYMPSNVASAAVLKRCGFSIEGEAEAYLRIDGAWRDHILTAIFNPEWRKK